MIRSLEIVVTSLLVVLVAPLMILTWLWLVAKGVRPVFVSEVDPRHRERTLTLFNVRGDDRISKWILDTNTDLLPCLLNVVGGSAGLLEVHRSCARIGQLRGSDRPQPSSAGRIFLAVVLGVALLILVLAFLSVE